MNTPARQSISKTLVKACTAAVLLVTCLNAQATDSNVQNLSDSLRAETMHSLEVEQVETNVIAPSLEFFNTSMEKVATSYNFRTETLESIKSESPIYVEATLNSFNVALDNFVASNDVATPINTYVASDTRSLLESIWANNIQPQFASFDTLAYETNDLARQEATIVAIDFAIKALETARTTFLEDSFSL